MNVKEVRCILSERAVRMALEEHGFTDRIRNGRFLRKSGEFIHLFQLDVYAEQGSFFSKPSLGIAWPLLNKLYNQIAEPKEPVRTNDLTVGLGFGIANEHPGRGAYAIETEEDLAAVAVKITSDFLEIGLPYFEANNDQETLERRLNQRTPEGGYVPTTVSASCMGLIAAHHCGRSDFESLADFYIDHISRVQRKEFAAPILKVKEFYLGSKRPFQTGVGVPMLKPKP